MTYNPESVFPSSLAINGTAKWNISSHTPHENEDAAKVTVNVGFSNVDWDNLRSTYGWAGIQFQAWSRGYLEVCSEDTRDTTVALYINNVGEFWIDEKQYFGGDFYGYRRAPVVVRLSPGRHRVDVRVTHDIRNFGGGMPPVLSFSTEAKKAAGGLVAVPEHAVVADVVDGKIVGEWASVPLRNEGHNWIEIDEVNGDNVCLASILETHRSYSPRRRSK